MAIAPEPAARREHPNAVSPVKIEPRKVDAKGRIRVRYAHILLGCEYAHATVMVLHHDQHVEVFDQHGRHIRSQRFEPGKTYYSNGRPRTYRRTQPQPSTLT